MKEVGSALLGGITSIGDLAPKPPQPKAAPPAPDPLDPAILNAQRQKMAQQSAQGGGRMSTILQDNQNYQSQQL